jgi:oligopeptide/dipeptide ABC transporter ATP-binding protein
MTPTLTPTGSSTYPRSTIDGDPTDELLTIDRVSKRFELGGTLAFGRGGGEVVRAVDDVSFSIGHGVTVALVGESGCGKTTTSRLVLRLQKPSDGRVLYRGRDIQNLRGSELRQYRSEVQAVLQDPWSSLNPRMRVRDIIAEPMDARQKLPRDRRRERIEELLAQVGLDQDASNSFPHEFSGGQRQRIAVARSLSVDPRLIVLDEPVSALDVSFRAQVMNLLKDLQEQLGISYLLIAHNLATVRYLSRFVAVMYLGRIVEHAPSEILFTHPLHPYTKALISAAETARPGVKRNRIILRGEVPSPLDPPRGCSFHPRCPLREILGRPPQCEDQQPVLREVGAGRSVACHFADPDAPAWAVDGHLRPAVLEDPDRIERRDD